METLILKQVARNDRANNGLLLNGFPQSSEMIINGRFVGFLRHGLWSSFVGGIVSEMRFDAWFGVDSCKKRVP